MNSTSTIPQTVDPMDLEKKVKQMYTDVALHPHQEYHFEMGRQLAEHLGYQPALLDAIPAASIDSFAGVGHYFDMASIQKGEHIVDLGCGSGMDVFYASQLTGMSGEVIGVDMTDAQLNKSKKLKASSAPSNTTFVKGHIEALPIVSSSIDVVVSNGVINLSSNKQRVFEEAARVLRKGGRLVLSDIVSSSVLPTSISCNSTYWAACIGGAITESDYTQLIEAQGLEIMAIKENPYAFISKGAAGATAEYGIKSISVLAIKK